ncbi:MAG: hypothetical protein OIF50_07235 [Flavobacteriaceae bacterium]|nr:hypothetical protein [Flavobacteriaceae bacterium]
MVWRLLLVVLLVGFSSGVSAQEKSKKIVIQKRELEGAIKLKWNITDEGNWLEIIRKGFVLERKEVRRDGKLLLESKPTVLDTLKIAPKKEWLKFDPVKNKYIAILSQALFGESFQVNAQSQSFINQIKQQKNDREQRFSVGNLSLSTDFNAAILGGSAYIDSTVNQESEYVYRIKSLYAPNNKEYQGIVLGSSSNYKPLNKPIAMEGVFGENKVNLGWRLSFENKPFIAYEIQVMGEDSVFVTVNKNLIIPDIDPNMPEFMKKVFTRIVTRIIV